MDLNDIRSVVTLVSFVLFLALMVHTWSRKRKAEYDEAANLPFAEATDSNEFRGEQT